MQKPLIASTVRCDSIIAHFDLDCFYAQTEILRNPHLRSHPVGVTQKFLVVTCNYVARELGVPKMVSIQEAQNICPHIVLINGEDLTPYRAASKEIMKVIGRFGVLERAGLDECYLDISSEIRKRFALGVVPNHFIGHIIDGNIENGLANERFFEEKSSLHEDRSKGSSAFVAIGNEIRDRNISSSNSNMGIEEDHHYSSEERHLLSIGSHYVAEIRAAVEKETGFQCSCGISYNKMLAKLACSINKPNKQTCLLKSALPGFLNPLPVRKIPGVGKQAETMLKEIAVQTVADLQGCTLSRLVDILGEKTGSFLFEACRGIDQRQVHDKGPPKSVSVEDSFPPCATLKGIEAVILSLAEDLIARLDEDYLETGRRPRLFTVKWRSKGTWSFTSTSSPMPSELLSAKCLLERRKEILIKTAMSLLSRTLGCSSFSIVVINIGASNFSESNSGTLAASKDIRSLMQNCKTIQRSSESPGMSEHIQHVEGAEYQNPKKYYSFQCLSNQDIDQQHHKFLQGNKLRNDHIEEATSSDLASGVQKGEQAIENFQNDNASCSSNNRTCSNEKFLDLANCGDLTHALNSSTLEGGGELRNSSTTMSQASRGINATEEASDLLLGKYFRESGNVQDDGTSNFYTCKHCGEKVSVGERSRQEHEDYHYAFQLQSKETGTANITIESNIKSFNASQASTKRQKRSQHGTLDAYFGRRPS